MYHLQAGLNFTTILNGVQDLLRDEPALAVRGRYRGYEIAAMPPPSSGGVHLVQILNILEGYDIAAMGFGSAEYLHTLDEAKKLGL